MSEQERITDLVDAARAGDERAVDELLPLIYEELRQLAERRLAREDAGHTLQATALVHEVYLRLAGQDRANWKGHDHLMAMAAETLRRVLIDHARLRKGIKRGGGRRPLVLDTSVIAPQHRQTDLVALNEALDRLAIDRPDNARVVTMRFFGGLSCEQVTGVMGTSTRTVERHWEFARAWLARELQGEA